MPTAKMKKRGKNPLLKESKSIYESLSGKKNPKWADKMYNPRTYQKREESGEFGGELATPKRPRGVVRGGGRRK